MIPPDTHLTRTVLLLTCEGITTLGERYMQQNAELKAQRNEKELRLREAELEERRLRREEMRMQQQQTAEESRLRREEMRMQQQEAAEERRLRREEMRMLVQTMMSRAFHPGAQGDASQHRAPQFPRIFGSCPDVAELD